MSVSTYVPDSTKILHTAYADFVSRQIGRVIHVVQYDDGLPLLAVKLFSDGQPYTIPSNADINIKLGKSDGTFVYNDALGCDSARHTAYFEITYQMVVLAEELSPIVEVLIGASVAASSSIGIIVDRNPIQNGSLESTSEWKMIQQSVEYAKEAVASAASASASRSAAAVSANNAKVSETNAAVSANNAKVSETNTKASENHAKTSETNAKASEINAALSEKNAGESEYRSGVNANESEVYSTISKSYAVGETGCRFGEDTDNAEYYSRKAGNAMREAKNSEYNADIYNLLARSYAVGDSAAVLGEDGFAFTTSDGAVIEFFGREGENTDNAKYYAEQAKKSADSIAGAEETVSEDLQTSLDALAEIRTLSAQVSENKTSVDTSEANARSYMENALEYSNNAKTSETNAKGSETNAKTSETNAKESETNARQSEESAAESASKAKNSEDSIKDSEDICSDYAKSVRSYAVGDTDYRENENVDNAKYYYQQAKQISEGLGGTLIPMGTIMFSDLSLQTKVSGYMFNISDDFISDSTFKDGGEIKYPAGTNVYFTADGYWDCLAGSLLSGIKGNAETDYRAGFVNITPENIGAYSKNDIDQLIEAVNLTISGLETVISKLTERIDELEYNSGLAHLLDSEGNVLVTSRNEILLTNRGNNKW